MPYRVFLPAPTSSILQCKSPKADFYWQTASSSTDAPCSSDATNGGPSFSLHLGKSKCRRMGPAIHDNDYEDWLLPPATLGAASQKISEMYRNVIFPEDDDGEYAVTAYEETMRSGDEHQDSSSAGSGEQSLISWPPTNDEKKLSRTSLFRSMTRSQLETEDYSENTSYAHTSTSSITAFPTFVINLRTLVSLSELASMPTQSKKWTRKINLLVAVLEIDGPDNVRIKKGPETGRYVQMLKLVVGGEEGGICKLTAWREVADAWSGMQDVSPDESILERGVKRGDIVYLENILASSPRCGTADSEGSNVGSHISLTASPNLGSRLHICYRTLPNIASDRRFRPDLRLAASDPSLRKIASIVQWLESVMCLNHA